MNFFFVLAALECTLGAVLFLSAGRLDLPWFWAVLGVHAGMLALAGSIIDPELRLERLRPAVGGEDRSMRWIALPFMLAHLVIAGLDVGRFGWSGELPVAVHASALAVYVLGIGVSVWAMRTNRFFSPVVRIQSERGHCLVSAGPYRYMRHPGYLGGLISSLSGGIALGSWWSLLPIVPLGLLVLRRIGTEERVLNADLDGYSEYMLRVPYRLVPRLW